MRLLFLLLLAGPVAAQPMIPPATLQAAVEVFAGQAAVVDPRLLLPVCARPALAWAPGGRSVAVSCDAPVWQVFVPLASAPPAETVVPAGGQPAIRRGDRVLVEVAGAGFVVGMAAVADGDARDGRVALRPGGGGRRLTGIIGSDGRVRLSDSSPMVNGR